MNTFEQVEKYVISKGSNLEKMSMKDIEEVVYRVMYPDLNPELKAYLEELNTYPNEFTIPHSKLLYFGAISKKSGSIVKSLKKLGFNEGKEYVKIYNGETKYMFTPDFFKFCLMRSMRRPHKNIDFMDYFFAIEKCSWFFMKYQEAYIKALK
jgi:hypothetical protein